MTRDSRCVHELLPGRRSDVGRFDRTGGLWHNTPVWLSQRR